VFRKWELDFAVVGRTTDTGKLVVRHGGAVQADIPLSALAHAAPVYERPWIPKPKAAEIAPEDVPAPNSLLSALETMMGSPHLCSRRWIWEQYDHMVMADTVQRPGGDAGVVRVHGTEKALAISCDVTPRYCAADPYQGAKQAVAECWRNLTVTGADPLAITDCMNFGNPERPEIMGEFVRLRAWPRPALPSSSPSCRATCRSTTRRTASPFRRRLPSAVSG
jgi:phosphoribosylformylglycinamidine synthase